MKRSFRGPRRWHDRGDADVRAWMVLQVVNLGQVFNPSQGGFEPWMLRRQSPLVYPRFRAEVEQLRDQLRSKLVDEMAQQFLANDPEVTSPPWGDPPALPV